MARLGRTFPIRPHMNFKGRTGIYFNRLILAGVVTLAGTPTSGVTVRVIRQSTDTEVMKTTTNASGYYEFTGYANSILAGENYHIMVEYTDGGLVKYNARSLWNIVPVVT